MFIEKITNGDKPVIGLIHSGNSSPEEWKDYIEALKEDFSIWLFTIPSHGKDFNAKYEPIRVNAVNFLNELKKEYSSCYLFGRGLGAQIAIAMCLEDGNFVKKAVFESALCVNPGLMTIPFRLKARTYNPDPESVKNGFSLSKQNMILMVRDNTSFILDNRVNECNTSIYVLHAEKDDKLLIQSADFLCGYFKKSKRAKYPYSHNLGITNFNEVFPPIKEFLLEKEEE